LAIEAVVETELFAQTYKNYGLATMRYLVPEATATVEPFENVRSFLDGPKTDVLTKRVLNY
jgi:hypothetical protein